MAGSSLSAVSATALFALRCVLLLGSCAAVSVTNERGHASVLVDSFHANTEETPANEQHQEAVVEGASDVLPLMRREGLEDYLSSSEGNMTLFPEHVKMASSEMDNQNQTHRPQRMEPLGSLSAMTVNSHAGFQKLSQPSAPIQLMNQSEGAVAADTPVAAAAPVVLQATTGAALIVSTAPPAVADVSAAPVAVAATPAADAPAANSTAQTEDVEHRISKSTLVMFILTNAVLATVYAGHLVKRMFAVNTQDYKVKVQQPAWGAAAASSLPSDKARASFADPADGAAGFGSPADGAAGPPDTSFTPHTADDAAGGSARPSQVGRKSVDAAAPSFPPPASEAASSSAPNAQEEDVDEQY